jgi:hypothetical protein
VRSPDDLRCLRRQNRNLAVAVATGAMGVEIFRTGMCERFGMGAFWGKKRQRVIASHMITVLSIKTALTDELAKLQKIESLGGCIA